MGSPAIDFAALLAEAREEARVRRHKQQQEQQQRQMQQRQVQQRQQQQGQQQQRQQQQQEQQPRQQEQEQQQRETQDQQGGEGGERLHLQRGRQGKLQQEGHAQQPECEGHRDPQVRQQGLQEASQQPRQRQQQEQCYHQDELLELEKQQQRELRQERTSAPTGGKCCADASHVAVRLRAIDVRDVYNLLQQHTVGVGKPVLLVDLQAPSAYECQHVRQAVSGPQVLQGGPVLQRLQQQPPHELLVYGSSHEEDTAFQQLMRQHTTGAATASSVQAPGGAASASHVMLDGAPVALLLQQLTKTLQEPPSSAAGTLQQRGEQQHLEERQPRSPCVGRRRSGHPAGGGERGVMVVAWLRGGLKAFAAAFPFLCVSSNTENEAAAAPSATNSVAYMSYPLLVYRNPPAQQPASDAAPSVAAAAAGEREALEDVPGDTVVPRPALVLSSSPAPLAAGTRAAAGDRRGPAGGHAVVGPAAANSGAAAAGATPDSRETLSAVHGLYVGTPLHATSKVVRRRLSIGLIIDLTCSGLPHGLSSSRCCSEPSDTSSSGSVVSGRGRRGGDSGNTTLRSGEGNASSAEGGEFDEDVQVVCPLVAADTRAAVRSFLGCGGDGGGSPPAIPCWLEAMPQRQRELAAAAGRYLLPLGGCVELLKHTFGPPRRRSSTHGVFAGAAVMDDAECASRCSSLAVGGSTCKSSSSSRKPTGTAYSDISLEPSGGTKMQLQWLKQKKGRGVAPVATAALDMGDSSSSGNTGRRTSVLIVHSGDSEAWSGSAAAAVVAGFLFAQQKRLQLVLPQQEVRTAVALLSASWPSAPSLESPHRQQLQRFCEEERKRIGQQSVEGGKRGAAPKKERPFTCEKQRITSRDDLADRGSSSLPRRAVGVSPTATGPQAIERSQVAESRSFRSGKAEEEEEDDDEEDWAGVRREEADDAYLAAAAALHTITLCGLPADPVFILSGDKENCASFSGGDTAEGVREGEDGDGKKPLEAKEEEEWPIHLLIRLRRISRQVTLVVARLSASTGQDGELDVCCTRESILGTWSTGGSSSDCSADEAVADKSSVATGSRRSGGGECDKANDHAISEAAAGATYSGCNRGFGHKEAGVADAPASLGLQIQENKEDFASETNRQYENGAVQLFACLCTEKKVEAEGGAASTREAAAPSECPRRVETGTIAALKAKRVAGSYLYRLSTGTQGRCADGTVALRNASDMSSSRAMGERVDVCEAWELAANTVGCIVRSWSPRLGERVASGVCGALRVLLRLLASACSVTLWQALSTPEYHKDVLSRVTTAWGALLLNACILWLRMAPALQRYVRPSVSERAENTRASVESSAAPNASHALLGETLLYTLLESILQLVKRLLLSRQYSRSGDAVSVPPGQRLLSWVEGDRSRRLRITPSTAASAGGVSTDSDAPEADVTGGERRSRFAEAGEFWLLGFPTVGLSMLVGALYGTFLRPQLAPKLHRKLMRAASCLATGEVPPSPSVPVASTPPVEKKLSRVPPASRAAVAEAAAAAAVSSVGHILKSEAVQTALQLAEVWAAVHPENLQKLLQEALQGQGGTFPREDDKSQDVETSRLPTSLGVVLRPLVFASEEYEGRK